MPHKIEVRQRPGTEDKISTGMNTQVFLDGKPLAASFIKIEANSKKVTKVLLEIYAQVDINVNTELEEVKSVDITPSLKRKTLKSKS